MSRDLVNALYDRSIRVEIITFLQKSAPEKGYKALIDRIYGAWRAEDGEKTVEEAGLVTEEVELGQRRRGWQRRKRQRR